MWLGVQVVNYSHLFPTRYAIELEGLKGVVSQDTFKEVSQREDSKKQIKKLLEDKYQGGKNKWFFQPLRVRTVSFNSSNNPFRIPRTLKRHARPIILYLLMTFRGEQHTDLALFAVLICFGSAFDLCSVQNLLYMYYLTCPRMTHAPTTRFFQF